MDDSKLPPMPEPPAKIIWAWALATILCAAAGAPSWWVWWAFGGVCCLIVLRWLVASAIRQIGREPKNG